MSDLSMILPDVIHQDPLCPFCYGELCSEDGHSWECSDCNAWWSMDGSHGERLNSDKKQCSEETIAYPNHSNPEIRSRRYRCVLDKDHKPPCRGMRVDNSGEDTYTWYSSRHGK